LAILAGAGAGDRVVIAKKNCSWSQSWNYVMVVFCIYSQEVAAWIIKITWVVYIVK